MGMKLRRREKGDGDQGQQQQRLAHCVQNSKFFQSLWENSKLRQIFRALNRGHWPGPSF